MEGRRSTRLPTVLPITLGGRDTRGVAFEENTWTLGVNQHGAKLSTSYRLAVGDQIKVENTVHGRSAQARVVRVTEKGREFEIGVELIEPQNVWGARNTPRDWKENDAASRCPGVPEDGSATGERPPQDDCRFFAPVRNELPPMITRAPEAIPDGQPGGLTSRIDSPSQSSPQEASSPNEDKATASLSPRFDSVADFLRASQAELHALIARTQEIQQKTYQAWQLILEEVHGKLHLELESISTVFAEDIRQRLRRETSQALQGFERDATARLSALVEDARAQSTAVQQKIDWSLENAPKEFERKLAELSASALQGFKHQGDALCGGLKDELEKWLDELKRRVTHEVSDQLRQDAAASFEILREQFTRWGQARIEESEKHLAAVSQSTVIAFTQRTAEAVHRQVDAGAGALQEAADQLTTRLESQFQESLTAFQMHAGELSEAALKDHRTALEVLLRGLHNRLEQAARALMLAGSPKSVDDLKSPPDSSLP